jgi:xylulokinase
MILAYDIGTTFLKAALVTVGGKVLASAQAPVRMVETLDPDRRECDPNTWLSGMALVTAQLGLKERGRIRAVVVSANGPTLVPVDTEGDPLDFAMTWQARRAQEEADLIAMTTHGRTGIEKLAYGSVAESVLESVPEIVVAHVVLHA